MDASETIKMDKRQAVIYLARFYEHEATGCNAKQEQLFALNSQRCPQIGRSVAEQAQDGTPEDKVSGQQALPITGPANRMTRPERTITEIMIIRYLSGQGLNHSSGDDSRDL